MKKMVMLESPEAATLVTKEVWVSRLGNLFLDERMARYDGCTHTTCKDCGEPCEKIRLTCQSCRYKSRQAVFLEMPEVIWDEKTPLCIFDTDIYFFNLDEIDTYCDEHDCKPQDLKLVVCQPIHLRQLTEEYFLDDIWNDEIELPQNVQQLIVKFNQDLAAINAPIAWKAGRKRTKIC